MVLIDLYLKDINMFFYSVFFLFESFLCLWYIAVVYLFWCGGVVRLRKGARTCSYAYRVVYMGTSPSMCKGA